MSKKSILIVALVIALCLPLAGCFSIGYFPATGPVETRDYPNQGFNSIDISNAIEFEINQSESYSLSITAQESIFSQLDIRQSGNTLEIRLKPGTNTNASIKAAVTLPVLSKLVVSGASRGSARGFRSTGEFQLDQSGASQLEIDMETGKTQIEVSGASRLSGNLRAQDTRIEMAGASRCELIGSAGTSNLEISGASHLRSPEFQMQDVTASVSGASQVTIYTSKTLSVDLSGASSLHYRGNPILSKVSVSGASRLVNDEIND